MAEKEKKETQSEATKTDDAQKETEKTEDFEAKYKELQGVHEKMVEESRSNAELLATLNETGAINWDAISGQSAGNGQTDTGSSEEFVDKKTVEQIVRSVKDSSENKLLALQFKIDHPELKPYETTLVGPMLLRLKRQHPRTSTEKLLEMTAKEVTGFLESERAKGKAEAEKTKKQKEEELAAAAGLDSAGATTPKETVGGQTNEEYIAERRAEKSKKMGA